MITNSLSFAFGVQLSGVVTVTYVKLYRRLLFAFIICLSWNCTRVAEESRELRAQKNRIDLPDSPISETATKFLRLPSKKLEKAGRSEVNWSTYDSTLVSKYEREGVRVTGYLVGEPAEKLEADSDFHIWIGPNSAKTKSDCIVAELTSYFRDQHNTWTLKRLRSVGKSGVEVRITGWLMWDEDHIPQVEQYRATT